MADYSKGVIYKLTNDVNDDIYVGSTRMETYMRLDRHLQQSQKDSKTSILYKAMREIGRTHFKLEVLEEYPCDSKQALLKKEREWI